jgi:hypothetical protein
MFFSLSVSFGKLQRNSYLYDLCSAYLTEAKATDIYMSSLITRYCPFPLLMTLHHSSSFNENRLS